MIGAQSLVRESTSNIKQVSIQTQKPVQIISSLDEIKRLLLTYYQVATSQRNLFQAARIKMMTQTRKMVFCGRFYVCQEQLYEGGRVHHAFPKLQSSLVSLWITLTAVQLNKVFEMQVVVRRSIRLLMDVIFKNILKRQF